MTRSELLKFDLTQPHAPVRVGEAWVTFKPKEMDVQRLYVPSFISWNGASRPGWRVRIDRTQGEPTKGYFSARQSSIYDVLYQAWEFVVDNLLEATLIPRDSKRVRSTVDTGVVGVWFVPAKPNNPMTLMLRVGQSTEADRAHNEIFYSLARDGVDPDHFTACYRRAIAARRYYEELHRSHYRLKTPITRETPIPERFFPATVPVPDLLEKALTIWGPLSESNTS